MVHRRTVVRSGGILLLVALSVALLAGPGWVESAFQGVVPDEPYRIDADAVEIHNSLIVADWHSDTLLWGRDPVKRSGRGHVDLLRLREGNVAIQMFTTFDGATFTSFDTSELAVLTPAMLRSGFTRDEIRKVMGENTVGFLEAQLPPS